MPAPLWVVRIHRAVEQHHAVDGKGRRGADQGADVSRVLHGVQHEQARERVYRVEPHPRRLVDDRHTHPAATRCRPGRKDVVAHGHDLGAVHEVADEEASSSSTRGLTTANRGRTPAPSTSRIARGPLHQDQRLTFPRAPASQPLDRRARASLRSFTGTSDPQETVRRRSTQSNALTPTSESVP